MTELRPYTIEYQDLLYTLIKFKLKKRSTGFLIAAAAGPDRIESVGRCKIIMRLRNYRQITRVKKTMLALQKRHFFTIYCLDTFFFQWLSFYSTERVFTLATVKIELEKSLHRHLDKDAERLAPCPVCLRPFLATRIAFHCQGVDTAECSLVFPRLFDGIKISQKNMKDLLIHRYFLIPNFRHSGGTRRGRMLLDFHNHLIVREDSNALDSN